MFFAALTSAFSAWPQAVQTNDACDFLDLLSLAPQDEQSWDVYAGLTATTRPPAAAAL